MLEVRLLGQFKVKLGGQPVSIPSRPAQALFAYLILNARAAHRREQLAGLLWPDTSDENARSNLRHALWRIRKAIETKQAYLIADDLTIQFDPDSPYWLDARAVDGELRDDLTTDDLVAALANYRGELLPGFYEEWITLERERLQAMFERKMEQLLDRFISAQRWADTLEWGEKWIAFGQTPEPAYRAMMLAHAASGNSAKVAATYERCIQTLRADLGVEPSEQTRELYENLKSGKAIPKAAAILTQAAAQRAALNIPVPLTSFIGRQKELKEIAKLLASARLLTLTGPGGVGKTRLAIQTAYDSIKKFKDGVFWTGLVGLSDDNLIPQEIAQALNVREIPPEPLLETLKSYLKAKDLLIVLDNCEHLIRACAQVAEQLLAACPKLKILATSIEGLGLFEETIWQVPSLPWPAAQQQLSLKELTGFASIELFDQRAGHARRDFVLSEKNAKSVIQICQRLDGIPLAIELAAARIKVLSVDEIAERLDDRFSLLTAGSRTAIPRHQTLRATIDWSYDLLTEPERILLRRLAVFAGGFTLEAVEAVCSQGLKRSDVLDLLGRLADKSLVIVEADLEISGTRYRLLETIRQYALEKLVEMGEAPASRDGHLRFFLNLAEKSEPKIFGSESAAWFSRLDKEIDNIRAAMEWSTTSGQAVAALQIAGYLVYFWFAHGLAGSEWHDRVQQALARPEGQARTLARAKALNGIGFMYWADIYPVDRLPELEEALSIGREFGDSWNIATALRNLGLLENIKGNYLEAQSFLEQSLQLWREMGADGTLGSAWTLIFLGDAALNHTKPEQARLLYQESVDILKGVGDINFLAYSLRRLGQLAWREGDYATALPLCRESLNLNRQINDPRGTLASLAGFADIAVSQGKLERAAQLMAAVDTQLSSTGTRKHGGAGYALGVRLLFIDKIEYEHNLALLRQQLDEKTLAKFWAKGAALTLEQAIAFALETRVELKE